MIQTSFRLGFLRKESGKRGTARKSAVFVCHPLEGILHFCAFPSMSRYRDVRQAVEANRLEDALDVLRWESLSSVAAFHRKAAALALFVTVIPR